MARALQVLVEGLTFGNFSQPVERSAAGYLTFAMLAVYLMGLILLPCLQHSAQSQTKAVLLPPDS